VPTTEPPATVHVALDPTVAVVVLEPVPVKNAYPATAATAATAPATSRNELLLLSIFTVYYLLCPSNAQGARPSRIRRLPGANVRCV
jgi:hypothetical protein